MSAPRRWTGGTAPRWSATPPTPRVKKYERLKIFVAAGETVVVVSSKLEECLTHFVDSRTVPCTGEQGKCWLDHCLVGNPRYAGWLAVKLPTASKVYLLSLTPVAVAIEPRLREPDRDLRGLTLRVWRLGNSERTELHAALKLEVPRVADLPQEPDLRFCLERMWGAKDRPSPIRSQRGPGLDKLLASQASSGSK